MTAKRKNQIKSWTPSEIPPGTIPKTIRVSADKTEPVIPAVWKEVLAETKAERAAEILRVKRNGPTALDLTEHAKEIAAWSDEQHALRNYIYLRARADPRMHDPVARTTWMFLSHGLPKPPDAASTICRRLQDDIADMLERGDSKVNVTKAHVEMKKTCARHARLMR